MSNIIQLYQESFKKYRYLEAITDLTSSKTYTYLQLAARIDQNHRLFKELGVRQGDNISLVGKNSAEWVCAYLSVVTYGAVIVPILADFNPIDMTGIIQHSDSVMLFADRAILAKLDLGDIPSIKKTVILEDMPDPDLKTFDIDSISYAERNPEDTMVISYTSGTTGNSKGVILPVRSLTYNGLFGISQGFFFPGSHCLGLLPLAHAYGCTFDMLSPLLIGAHMHILGKIPSPNVLLNAIKKVQPTLLCTVPLVIEKVVQKGVLPKINKQPVKSLIKIPLINCFIYARIGKLLRKTLGESIREINMGGAALDKQVEKILMRAHFPFTVGYGMTETGPLVSYVNWRKFRRSSCGKPLEGTEIKILTENPGDKVGRVCVRGESVFTGYYKNPEATAAALRDGWFVSGDMGYVDKDGYLFLKGRCNSMILTSSGQNIYPEEIESKLATLEYIQESIAYEADGKIFALVVPDFDRMKKEGIGNEEIKTIMKNNLVILNRIVAPYEKVAEIIINSEPFEKTPKQSIKRYLYPKNAKPLV